MKKVILGIVILIVIAVLSVPLWIDSAAVTAVEEGATMALGVPTKLDSMGISIFGGECTMAGLHVDNPEGFDTPHFMKLDDGFVAVSLGTLMEDTIVVPEITLTGIDMNLEKKGGKSNYKVLLDNLDKGEKEPKKEGGKKFVIEKIVVKDIRVQTKMELIGGVNPGVKVKIPQIVLNNVGSDTEGGVVMRDVFDQLIKGILKGIVDSGVNLGGDIGKELGKGLKDVVGVSAEVVGEGTKEVTDAIGGLFGGKKKVAAVRVAAIVLFLCAAALAKPSREDKYKEKLGKVWLDYARWCKVQQLKEEGTRALGLAGEAAPQTKDLQRLAADLEKLPENKTPGPDLDKRRAKAHKDAAKLYDRLAKLDHAPADAARFEGYIFRAAELEPSKGRLARIAAKIKQLSGNRKTTPQAGRLLVRLKEINPEGKYNSLEAELARKDVLLIKSPDHDMVGYVSLPDAWKKGGSYPVMVAVDGAGSGFVGRARNFAQTRGKRAFIVLTPCSLSNTNKLEPKKYPFYAPEHLEDWNRNRIAFDTAGLEALLKVVRERFGAGEGIAITGFSGGGNLCYAMTVLRPKTILFSAPACANFGGMGFSGAKEPEAGGPPIRILTGANDKHKEFTHGNKNSPGIEPQTDNAVAKLKELGYTNLTRTMLKGVGHSPCAAQVWAIADEIVKR